jgi:hypothetical protein
MERETHLELVAREFWPWVNKISNYRKVTQLWETILGHFLYSTKRLRIADLDYWKTKQNKTVTNLVAQNLQKKFAKCKLHS